MEPVSHPSIHPFQSLLHRINQSINQSINQNSRIQLILTLHQFTHVLCIYHTHLLRIYHIVHRIRAYRKCLRILSRVLPIWLQGSGPCPSMERMRDPRPLLRSLLSETITTCRSLTVSQGEVKVEYMHVTHPAIILTPYHSMRHWCRIPWLFEIIQDDEHNIPHSSIRQLV